MGFDTFRTRTRTRPRSRPRGSEFYRGRGTRTIGAPLILRHRDEVSYKHRLWPRASSLIVEETLKKRISNNECRMSKLGILSILIKTTEQSETTLRHSAVRYSIFCGSLFSPACKPYGLEAEQEAGHLKFHILVLIIYDIIP